MGDEQAGSCTLDAQESGRAASDLNVKPSAKTRACAQNPRSHPNVEFTCDSLLTRARDGERERRGVCGCVCAPHPSKDVDG